MFILTNISNVIIFITTEVILKNDGIHVGGGLIFADKTLNIINILDSEITSDIIPQKYCYTEQLGFYLNPNNTTNYTENSISEKVEYLINKIEPVIDISRISLSDLIISKVKEIGKCCTGTIENGIDVTLSDGSTEHFSLTDNDQKNIKKINDMIIYYNVPFVPYHSDSNQCKMYSAKDFKNISMTADLFILNQTNYCNSVNTWIRRCTSKDEVLLISYGQQLPDDLQLSLNILMNKITKVLLTYITNN